MRFNFYAFKAIYLHEMDRFKRTLGQSLISPVISTSLYFIVFGSVIGGYVEKIDGISYGSYIVPGLLMLTLLTQSISNTSFGIFFSKFNGTIYEILAAPISTLEIVLAFVGAGALVNKDVEPFEMVAGVPARRIGWVDKLGNRTDKSPLDK